MPRLVPFTKGQFADALQNERLRLDPPDLDLVVEPGHHAQCLSNLDTAVCAGEPDVAACRCRHRGLYQVCGVPYPACP